MSETCERVLEAVQNVCAAEETKPISPEKEPLSLAMPGTLALSIVLLLAALSPYVSLPTDPLQLVQGLLSGAAKALAAATILVGVAVTAIRCLGRGIEANANKGEVAATALIIGVFIAVALVVGKVF